jgi:hypothetical protein
MDGHSSALDSIFAELAAETGGDADLMRDTFFRRIHKEQR